MSKMIERLAEIMVELRMIWDAKMTKNSAELKSREKSLNAEKNSLVKALGNIYGYSVPEIRRLVEKEIKAA